MRAITRRPDTIVGFGDTRIHAETATFEVRVSEVANPQHGDQLTVGGARALPKAGGNRSSSRQATTRTD